MAGSDSTEYIEYLLCYMLFCLILTIILWFIAVSLFLVQDTFLRNILSHGNFSNTIVIKKFRQTHGIILKGILDFRHLVKD